MDFCWVRRCKSYVASLVRCAGRACGSLLAAHVREKSMRKIIAICSKCQGTGEENGAIVCRTCNGHRVVRKIVSSQSENRGMESALASCQIFSRTSAGSHQLILEFPTLEAMQMARDVIIKASTPEVRKFAEVGPTSTLTSTDGKSS